MNVGDYVKIKINHYGYLRGDIGMIVRDGKSLNPIIFVPNRNSHSSQKPNVSFDKRELIPSTEYEYNLQHGITPKNPIYEIY